MSGHGRRAVLDAFRWQGAHGDIWSVFADGDALQQVVDALAAPWEDCGVTKVAGIESRGFLLGGAVAVRLGVGFVAIRKDAAGMLPGSKLLVTTEEDYRGRRHQLRMQAVLGGADQVLLVDDWMERGSQARAAAELVHRCGARFLGVSVVVDELEEQVRRQLGRVTALVSREDLGDPDGAGLPTDTTL